MNLISFLKFLKKLYYTEDILNGIIHDVRKTQNFNRTFGCNVHPKAFLSFEDITDIKIGKGSMIGPYSVVYVQNFPGEKNSDLIIGENTYIAIKTTSAQPAE